MAAKTRICPCGKRFKVRGNGYGTWCSRECQRIWPAERAADHRTLAADDDDESMAFPDS